MLKTTLYLLTLVALSSISLPAQSSQEGQVARDGFTLHYKSVGAGKPLLLLSGGPGFDVDYMTPIALELSSWYRCILLEQRGTGRSRPASLTPETLNIKLLVEDIEAVRASLGIDRLPILGHSWGGVLAMAYAAAHPEHVDSLVLVASGGSDPSFGPVFQDNIAARASMSERQKIQEFAAALGRAADPQAAWHDFFKLLVPYYFFDRDRGEKFITEQAPGSFHPDTSQLLAKDMAQNLHIQEQLKKLRRPALIIQGHQDPMPESVAEQTHELLKDSQLAFLDRCGHFPWLEQPSALYERIHSFLKLGPVKMERR